MALDFPESDEFVVCTVKKIMPYGAFCSLDEYGGMDSFLHVSQVSSGWIRNIREHLREGQKLVAKVITIDRDKGQVDLSLKQVTEADRKRKLANFQEEKKANKLIEVAAIRLKQPKANADKLVIEPLVKKFGSLSAGLAAIRETDFQEEIIPTAWADVLKEIVSKEMKARTVEVRKNLTISSSASDGINVVINALEELEKLTDKKTSVHVHYLAAPNFFVQITSTDYKTAEKKLLKIRETLEQENLASCDYELEE